MFCRLLIACCLCVVVKESYGINPARKYAPPLSVEARMAINEKMKYIMPRSDGKNDAPSWLIESYEKDCENATQVRDEVLSKLNASLSCGPKPECNESYPYREPDGSCNNVMHPDWGRRNSCLRRVLEPAYADGISEPRRSCNGSELPSPRLISTMIHYEKNITNDNITHLAMIFGQFLTHDITFVAFGPPLSEIEFELGA
ncbi:hypothetical protein V5799_017537 [Amblyomma americanum]|uniref:Uncharacterized protein n=1 Tax=Amblyomma americanum TaxID=6943 RepID=A0AAQ4F2H0_AMBAM